jgi:hypothetical protein
VKSFVSIIPQTCRGTDDNPGKRDSAYAELAHELAPVVADPAQASQKHFDKSSQRDPSYMEAVVTDPIRVLVVDDSAFMRKALSREIGADPRFTIAGTACNGLEGVRLALQ